VRHRDGQVDYLFERGAQSRASKWAELVKSFRAGEGN
jgi:hypothetical protein